MKRLLSVMSVLMLYPHAAWASSGPGLVNAMFSILGVMVFLSLITCLLTTKELDLSWQRVIFYTSLPLIMVSVVVSTTFYLPILHNWLYLIWLPVTFALHFITYRALYKKSVHGARLKKYAKDIGYLVVLFLVATALCIVFSFVLSAFLPGGLLLFLFMIVPYVLYKWKQKREGKALSLRGVLSMHLISALFFSPPMLLEVMYQYHVCYGGSVAPQECVLPLSVN